MSQKAGTLIIRTAYLFALWVVFSGKMAVFHLSAGLVCAILIAWVSLSFEPTPSAFRSMREIPGIAWRAVCYGFWLMGRIFLAAFHVSRLIVSRKMSIAPEVIKHKTILTDDLEKVIFAHSITLTPGTITADINGEVMTIHRLDAASSDDISSGVMEMKIKNIFRFSAGKL